MADALKHTEAWENKPWKRFQRVVFRLQKRIYQAEQRGDRCHSAVGGARDKGYRIEELDDRNRSRPVLQRQGVGQPTS